MQEKHTRFYKKISYSTERVLQGLNSYGRPHGQNSFPPGTRWNEIKNKPANSNAQWLRNCVEMLHEENRMLWQLENHIALFSRIDWEKGNTITFLSMQALVSTEADLQEVLQGKEFEGEYYRADYHRQCVGRLLREPLVHIHSSNRGEPRFPLSISITGNVVMDFIEFLYRNHEWDIWNDWAENVWEHRVRRTQSHDVPYENIRMAFDGGKSEILLGTYRESVLKLKQALTEDKSEAFDMRIPEQDIRLLSYP